MSTDLTRHPVTATHLPLVRCAICRRTVARRPGPAGAVLTGHYETAHPDAATLAFFAGLPRRRLAGAGDDAVLGHRASRAACRAAGVRHRLGPAGLPLLSAGTVAPCPGRTR